ncbi:unnamed protein product [Paramecium sonneborni]|uniref:Arrestin C-terminal-like domain-containing protein n=1 Tax=Paramecium sonneborni TaxID=65129 RepID=A0A8S1KM83_9CILI|nr:unnamed protein product [Paramecium sonneborni]
MISNQILFWIKNPVSSAGENIDGICYVRLIDEIQQAHVQLIFVAIEYSKILHKRQKLLEKNKQIQITLDSPRNFKMQINPKKKYELLNGTMFQITRQYGVNDDYTHIQDLYRGKIQSGDYKLPFQVPTKFGMNSSFCYKKSDGQQQAKIQYKIYLKISDSQSNQVIIQNSIPVYINSRYKQIEQKRESEGNIVQFFCIHRGMIELRIRTAKNLYKPGEVLELEYILNSTRSQRQITKVEVKLNHFLSFTDDDENERQIENKILYSNILPGIASGKRSEILKCSITIPNDLKATVKMQFIHNRYILQVEAFADGLLTNLAVPVICQIPIIILERRQQEKLNLIDWKFNNQYQENNSFYQFTSQQQQLFN